LGSAPLPPRMSKLKRKDWVELGVAVAALSVYLGLWATGQMPDDTPVLIHAIVGGSAVAILGDNLLTWLEEAPS